MNNIVLKMYSLFDYQEDICTWMKDVEEQVMDGGGDLSGGMLILEMGLGKTLISLHNIFTSELEGVTLIVMSKTLMSNWVSEIEKFGFTGILYYHKDFIKNYFDLITYDEFIQYKVVLTTYDVVNSSAKINAELIERVKIIGEEKGIHFGKIIGYRDQKEIQMESEFLVGKEIIHNVNYLRIICDESQRFANPKTKLFKNVLALYGKIKWCLTGTPIRNVYKDIWSQLKFCGYNSISVTGFNYKEYSLIKNIYRLKIEDVNIKLPPLDVNRVELEFDEDHLNIYDAYMNALSESIREFELKICGFSCVLEAFLRLRQVSVCPSILNENSNQEIIPTQKIIFIVNKIKEIIASGEKVILFTMYESIVNIFEHMMEMEGITYLTITGKINSSARRKEILDDFKLNKSVLFLNYRIGAEGLTIVEANNVILIEPWWNPATHNQAISRCHRTGQTKQVNVYIPIMKNSIEKSIMDMCDSKHEQSVNLLGNKGKMNNVKGINLKQIKKMINY